MSHHPTCPLYKPCRYNCHMLESAPPLPPPAYHPIKGAVQSTRVVQTVEQAAQQPERPEHHRYTKARQPHESERRVHFAPRRRGLDHHAIERHLGPSPRSILVHTEATQDVDPTVYVVTFATEYMRNTPRNVERLVESQVPRRSVPILHLCMTPN
jgi:hypothetical protein